MVLVKFLHKLVKFFQMLPDSILFSNGRFELQYCGAAADETQCAGIWEENYWSSNWRNFPLTEVGKFRLRACKIWQNLTKFDKLAIKFLNDSFPDYILDCSKFCQILSNFFEWLSNFYINLVKFCQMLSDASLFSNGRFELQPSADGPHWRSEKP